ncbi:hypothetical protein [Henriciella aquimarina]|uniref:hypothetical protein n=1 Tax=Henriciella aquimarina TaxID=545261 RepID=UPI000A0795D9|nr:hypothetical protein [Henriciella aquimarina]
MMADEPQTTTGHEDKPRLNPSARHWALPLLLMTLLITIIAAETGQFLAWLFTTLFALATFNIWIGGGRPVLSLSEFFHTGHDRDRRIAPIIGCALLSGLLLFILYLVIWALI